VFNVYYRLRPDCWGFGYAREIVRAAACCVNEQAPAVPMQAAILPWNIASVAVAEAVGMTNCGPQPDHTGQPKLIFQAAAELLL
jgi:RimJ/RimL family protein N-acetyltransferase